MESETTANTQSWNDYFPAFYTDNNCEKLEEAVQFVSRIAHKENKQSFYLLKYKKRTR